MASASATPQAQVTEEVTQETAEEAEETIPPTVRQLGDDMCSKLTEFLRGELTASCEDYELLERMNRATLGRYQDMKQIASSVAAGMAELNEKYGALQPYLVQIDEIDAAVEQLEESAYKLDAYSKKLEAKFRQLERR